jgi:alpha-tubulin suppressor-like RCC1 family protein
MSISPIFVCGNNAYGQLGLNDSVDRYSPTQFLSDKNWAKVLVGSQFFCGITDTGDMWVCGKNSSGQLCQNDTVSRSSIVQFGPSGVWQDVTNESDIIIALRKDGTLWSSAGFDQYGTSAYPVPPNPPLSSVIQIGAENDWTRIAQSNMGKCTFAWRGSNLYGWGYNESGNLGVGTVINYSSPVLIDSSGTWSMIHSSGNYGFFNYSMGVKTDGTLWAAGGLGYTAVLGTGDLTAVSSWTQVGNDTNWSSVACALDFTVALKKDGTLWAWGYRIEIVPNEGSDFSSPVQVGRRNNWVEISAGLSTVRALKNDNTLWVGKANVSGVFGTGSLEPYKVSFPTQINSNAFWNSPIGGTGAAMFGVKMADGPTPTQTPTPPPPTATPAPWPSSIPSTGQLGCMGRQSSGDFGNNTPRGNYGSLVTTTANDWKSIATGNDDRSYAKKSDNTWWCTGYNFNGVLGIGIGSSVDSISNFVQFSPDTDWTNIYYDWYIGAGTKTDGSLWTWGTGGLNAYNGNIYLENTSSPTQLISSGVIWVAIGAGGMAIKNDNSIYAWGPPAAKLGTTEVLSSPTQIFTPGVWAKCAMTPDTLWGNPTDNSVLIRTDGTLWTCGANSYGQLGVNNTISVSSPVQVGTESTWTQCWVGYYSTFGLKADNTLWCWGYNYQGVFGNLQSDNSFSSPVQVLGNVDYDKIVVNIDYVAAIDKSKNLWVWGNNNYQQFGLGEGIDTCFSSPTQATWLGKGYLDVGIPYFSIQGIVFPALSPTPTGLPATATPTPTPSGTPAPTPSPTPTLPVVTNINFLATENGATLDSAIVNVGNVDASYFGPNGYNLSMNTAAGYTAIGTLFTNNSNTNNIKRSVKNFTSASTFTGRGSYAAPFNMVVDLGQIRTFNQLRAYQSQGNGRCTAIALDISSDGNLNSYSSPNWTQACPYIKVENLVSGYFANFPDTTARYIRLRLYNDGTIGGAPYTQLYNAKLFYVPQDRANFAAIDNGATLGGAIVGGGNVSSNYYGPSGFNLSMNTAANYTAPQCLFTNSNNTNTIARSIKKNGFASTFYGKGSAGSPFYIVVDLGQERTFNQARYYQTFESAKTTHAALDISSDGNLNTYSSPNWTQVSSYTVLDNSNTSAGVAANFPDTTARYIRLRIYNDGRYKGAAYTQFYNFKLFYTVPAPAVAVPYALNMRYSTLTATALAVAPPVYEDGVEFNSDAGTDIELMIQFLQDSPNPKQWFIELTNDSLVNMLITIGSYVYVVEPSNYFSITTMMPFGQKITVQSASNSDFTTSSVFGKVLSLPTPDPTPTEYVKLQPNLIAAEGSPGSVDTSLLNGQSIQQTAYLTITQDFNQVKVMELPNGAPIDQSIQQLPQVIPLVCSGYPQG